MPTLPEEDLATLLIPYFVPSSAPPPTILPQLSLYLDLLVKWNARTNLTAIRDPREIVRRHFGESLFAAQHLGPCPTLLDFGSGAGFPGLPIALLRPEISITLAESQNKKATFLREVIRSLGLPVEVWSGRVEALPATRSFHTVALRAVDHMAAALEAAAPRATHELLLLSGNSVDLPTGFLPQASIPLPNAESTKLILATRLL